MEEKLQSFFDSHFLDDNNIIATLNFDKIA